MIISRNRIAVRVEVQSESVVTPAVFPEAVNYHDLAARAGHVTPSHEEP
jgi:hypothetical protein